MRNIKFTRLYEWANNEKGPVIYDEKIVKRARVVEFINNAGNVHLYDYEEMKILF